MRHSTHEGSSFVRHIPCDACGSRDNAAEFTDGHTYCFGCGAHTNGRNDTTTKGRKHRMAGGLLETGEIIGLHSRKITEETCRKFGYNVLNHRGQSLQIAPYYDADGSLVAQKVRTRDKKFSVRGSLDEALPFGAHCWPKTGKMLVVTEGEIDAMSMSQAQGNKWPVVSIPCGAGPQVQKYMAKRRDYFSGFEKVVLMFDSDEPGREAAALAASVLGRRCAIAELPLKDANEMLVAGRVEELMTAMWRAKEYRPEGIVDMHSLLDAVKQAPSRGLSLPFEAWDAYTYGLRLGELWAFGAGTGVGKTDLFTQLVKHLITVHGKKVGVFSLERTKEESAIRIAGKLVEKTLHVPDSGWDVADVDRAWAMIEPGQVAIYDSFGANEWATVRDKIEYLYHAEGVQYFFLDHLTALAAAEEDERTGLERIMAEMGGLVKQIPIWVGFVSHLATPEGKSHEEGGRVTIRHFKGSRSIGYWSHFMFGMERDQQAEDETIRSTTTFRCLKDRYTGRGTGKVFYLGYDDATGMLYETEAPEERSGKAHGFTDEAPERGSSDF